MDRSQSDISNTSNTVLNILNTDFGYVCRLLPEKTGGDARLVYVFLSVFTVVQFVALR